MVWASIPHTGTSWVGIIVQSVDSLGIMIVDVIELKVHTLYGLMNSATKINHIRA